jgi:hypothetical protein
VCLERRWLRAGGRAIPEDDRHHILLQISNMRWAATKAQFQEKWQVLHQFCLTKGLHEFVEYFQAQYLSRSDMWSASGDPLQSDWGSITNNLLEAQLQSAWICIAALC